MRTTFAALLLGVFAPCLSQTTVQDIYPARLDAILSLPLTQAVKQRERYKVPLKAAYDRQMALESHDCETAISQQQPYNICMGQSDEQADRDYASFYNNLQMLCHDQEELAAMHSFERSWATYRESGMKTARASWPDGSGAPGFAAEVYLTLVRHHMRELHEIYGLNISQ